MEDVLSLIREKRIVPVVKLDRLEDALPLGKALIEGGLPIAEITFRTAAAAEAIRRIRTTYPEMLCGAGTIVNLLQAKAAVESGAAFLVSPGFSEEVTQYAIESGVPIFPGCCTPAEIMKALRYDLSIVKFFPAKQYGGLNTIKALSAPFPDMKFMPTGGIGIGNLKEYLDFDKIFACGGSWMASPDLIAERKFNEITRLSREAVSLVGRLDS